MSLKDLHGKTKKLGDYILQQIYTGEYTPDSAIPTIRAYIEMFNVSQRTVQRTLEILVDRGILETRHGQGTFVKSYNRNAISGIHTVTVILNSSELKTNIYGNIFYGLQQAAIDMNCQLNVKSTVVLKTLKIKDVVENSDGLIILSEQVEALERSKLPVPVVGVCMRDNYNNMVSILDIDPFASARQAVDYFKASNFEKIHVFSANIPSYVLRGKIFIDEWRDHGGKCSFSVLPFPIKELQTIPNQSALLFTTGSAKESYLRLYYQKNGIKLEETCTILEIDGKSRINPEFIKSSSIAVDWKQIGRMALEEVIYRLTKPGTLPRRIYVPGKLYIA